MQSIARNSEVFWYPTLFTKTGDGKVLIEIPDFQILTQGENIDDARLVAYLNTCYYYNKKISHLQSIYDQQQDTKYLKKSKKVLKLYKKRRDCINDIIHKATRYVTDYCIKNNIHTVIIGNITHIRDDNNLGRTNQVFHALPFKQIYQKLEYKLNMYGITLIKQKENYSSQCSPTSIEVSKEYAKKSNRKYRGLYIDNGIIYNADMVGAYNILRLFTQSIKKELPKPLIGLSNPFKVTV